MLEEILANIENRCNLTDITKLIAVDMIERGYDSKTIADYLNQSHYSDNAFCM